MNLDALSIASNGFISNNNINPLNVAMNGFLISVEIISVPRRSGGSSYYDPKTGAYKSIYKDSLDNISETKKTLDKKIIKVSAIIGDKKLTKVISVKEKYISINNIKIDIIENNIKIKIKK